MFRDTVTQLRGRIALVSVFAVALLTLSAPCAQAIEGNGKLQIHHIAVGQGDGAVLISPLGQVVLIDSGDNCTQFLSYISSLGITSVDYHFASHYHADHIGCLDNLLASGVTLNLAGYDRGYSYTTVAYTNYVNAVGGKRQTMAKNQVVTLDSLSAHPVFIKCVDLNGAGVYSPTGTDENAKSMVLKVSYGEFDESFGGDLKASPAVEATVGPEMGDVEVYKVHHHSSATSSYDEWLNATTPEVGVISLGSNSYGFVNEVTLTRLHNHGVKTYWTHAGSAAAPVAGWDKVGGNIVIQADWQPGAAYTVTGSGFVDTYYNSGTADLTPPQVAVVAPAGGDSLYVGSQKVIRWIATDNVGVDSVNIYYSTNGGVTFPYTIATGEQNDSSYTWLVPNTYSDSCVVKIVAYDHSLNSGVGVSGSYFSIRSDASEDGGIVAWGLNTFGQCIVPAPNANFVAVAAAGHHNLGLKPDGSIIAWGWNNYGQCDVPAPNADFVAVAAGGYHSLGLKSNGIVVAWGLNGDGQCDIPAPNADFVAIAGGGYHSLGLKSNGSVVVWGGTTWDRCIVPAPNADFVAIAGAGWHSLGLKSDGTVVAWGKNTEGQCSVPAPNAGFVKIAAGGDHSLGIKSNRTVVAWGRNTEGQCNVPELNAGFWEVSAGAWHSLGLRCDGSIVAWGWNNDGQCNVPAPNAGFLAVAAGAWHSLGVKGLLSGPTAVTFLACRAGVDNNAVTLSWQVAYDVPASSFLVERGSSVQGDYAALGVEVTRTDGTWFSCTDRDVTPGATYWYKISLVGTSGRETYGPVEVKVDAAPRAFAMYQSYPNPFNPTCFIRFDVPFSGRVTLRVFDASGRVVRTLVDRWLGSGSYTEVWNGRNDEGVDLPSGVYMYELATADFRATRKAVMLR